MQCLPPPPPLLYVQGTFVFFSKVWLLGFLVRCFAIQPWVLAAGKHTCIQTRQNLETVSPGLDDSAPIALLTRAITFICAKIILNETLVPITPTTGKRQTIDKSAESAPPKLITTASMQRDNSVVDNHTHQLLTIALTLQLLKVSSSAKRHCVGSRVTLRLLRRLNSAVGKRRGVVVQAQGEENGRHVVVVGEVGVQLSAQGEGGVVAVEGGVGRCVVDDCFVGQTGDQLVCEADALGWAQGIAGAVAVVFV